jgi:hypothetical protein
MAVRYENRRPISSVPASKGQNLRPDCAEVSILVRRAEGETGSVVVGVYACISYSGGHTGVR